MDISDSVGERAERAPDGRLSTKGGSVITMVDGCLGCGTMGKLHMVVPRPQQGLTRCATRVVVGQTHGDAPKGTLWDGGEGSKE